MTSPKAAMPPSVGTASFAARGESTSWNKGMGSPRRSCRGPSGQSPWLAVTSTPSPTAQHAIPYVGHGEQLLYGDSGVDSPKSHRGRRELHRWSTQVGPSHLGYLLSHLCCLLGRAVRRSVSERLRSYSLVSRYVIATAKIRLASVHTPSGVIAMRKTMPPMSPHFTYLPLLNMRSPIAISNAAMGSTNSGGASATRLVNTHL